MHILGSETTVVLCGTICLCYAVLTCCSVPPSDLCCFPKASVFAVNRGIIARARVAPLCSKWRKAWLNCCPWTWGSCPQPSTGNRNVLTQTSAVTPQDPKMHCRSHPGHLYLFWRMSTVQYAQTERDLSLFPSHGPFKCLVRFTEWKRLFLLWDGHQHICGACGQEVVTPHGNRRSHWSPTGQFFPPRTLEFF